MHFDSVLTVEGGMDLSLELFALGRCLNIYNIYGNECSQLVAFV